MVFFAVLLGVFAVFLYLAAVFVVASKIQDHCDRFPVAAPWVFSMFMVFAVPAAIICQLIAWGY